MDVLPRIRFFLFTALSFSLMVHFITGCGGSGEGVSGQATNTVTAQVKATIFSSVPITADVLPCAITCEFSFTAGANETLKVQQTLPIPNAQCDANGVPQTGQGIETSFTVDPSDPEVMEGGVVEVSCAPAGATLLDDVTFNFFSDSLDFIAQDCLRQGGCTVSLELTSLKDQLTSSGLFALLSSLQCPTLDFAESAFCAGSGTTTSATTDSGVFCSILALVRGLAGCADCGNGKLEEGETCDGNAGSCTENEICAPPGAKKECTCIPMGGIQRCADGQMEPGDTCDSVLAPCIGGTTCTLTPAEVCSCPPPACVPPADTCGPTSTCCNDLTCGNWNGRTACCAVPGQPCSSGPCCDGTKCDSSTETCQVCGKAGDICGTSDDCCDGFGCNAGTCECFTCTSVGIAECFDPVNNQCSNGTACTAFTPNSECPTIYCCPILPPQGP